MKRVHIYIAALFTMMLCAAPMRAADRSIVAADSAKALNESWPVVADARIEVGNVRGSVAVMGWDQPQVTLSGSLGAGSKLDISGDAQHLTLRVGATGNSWFGGNGPTHDSALVVHVPRAVVLELHLVSADGNVDGVAGRSLSAHGVSGKLTLNSGAGSVDVNNVSGDVTFVVPTNGATARAHLQTVSGDIDVKGLSGRIKLETVSGNIACDGTQVLELEAGTVSGDTKISLTPAANARLHMESMSGSVRLRVPATLSAHIDASTFSGTLRSDFGTVRTKDYGPGSSVDANIGSADAQIGVQSLSGDIELRGQSG